MSRIGKKPIAVPEKVNVKIDQGQTLDITIEGPKGNLFKTFPNNITVTQEENFLVVLFQEISIFFLESIKTPSRSKIIVLIILIQAAKRAQTD